MNFSMNADDSIRTQARNDSATLAPRQPRTRAGFSLIEVIMATLILALGLLGLGAVLPVIIRQQAASSDEALGTSAMQSALGHIEGNKTLAGENWKKLILGGDDADRNGELRFPPGEAPADFWRSQRWVVPQVNVQDSSTYLFPRVVDLTTANTISTFDVDSLPLASRLFPTPESGEAEPQFVWDMAYRRDFKGGGVQIAVFVRRVDPLATKALSGSLYTALLDPRSPEARLPVSVDVQGRPRLDGSRAGRYSTPLAATVVVPDSANPNADRRLVQVLSISDPGDQVNGGQLSLDVAYPLMAQPGQKLVDNLGNVYTVDGDAGVPGGFILRLTRPIPSSVPIQRIGVSPPPGVRAEAFVPPAFFQQVVFTPQVPVSVEVTTKKFNLAPDAIEQLTGQTTNPGNGN
jgi:prepilin-type N-terminal cleavage/methylation domain-containing protein